MFIEGSASNHFQCPLVKEYHLRLIAVPLEAPQRLAVTFYEGVPVTIDRSVFIKNCAPCLPVGSIVSRPPASNCS